jgi:hypothetical protein
MSSQKKPPLPCCAECDYFTFLPSAIRRLANCYTIRCPRLRVGAGSVTSLALTLTHSLTHLSLTHVTAAVTHASPTPTDWERLGRCVSASGVRPSGRSVRAGRPTNREADHGRATCSRPALSFVRSPLPPLASPVCQHACVAARWTLTPCAASPGAHGARLPRARTGSSGAQQ